MNRRILLDYQQPCFKHLGWFLRDIDRLWVHPRSLEEAIEEVRAEPAVVFINSRAAPHELADVIGRLRESAAGVRIAIYLARPHRPEDIAVPADLCVHDSLTLDAALAATTLAADQLCSLPSQSAFDHTMRR